MISIIKEIIMKNNFARNLKYYRKLNHISQDELAEMLGVTHQAISLYESGKRTCTFDVLIELGELFGISIDELIIEDHEK